MRNWPLRWKVALYSASLAVTATVGGAITTWFVMRHAEIAAFDRRLSTDAQEFFRDVEHFEGGQTNNRRVFKEIFVPLSLRKRLVEVTDASGTVLYLSPRLRKPFPRDGIKNFHNHKVDGQNVRLAEFSENGLTLRAGDDLKEINQLGRDSDGALDNPGRFGLGREQSDRASRGNPPSGEADHRAAARSAVACPAD